MVGHRCRYRRNEVRGNLGPALALHRCAAGHPRRRPTRSAASRRRTHAHALRHPLPGDRMLSAPVPRGRGRLQNLFNLIVDTTALHAIITNEFPEVSFTDREIVLT